MIAALISLGASFVWFATGQVATGVIWLVCSVVWLGVGLVRLRSPATEPEPMRHLARRLSRLLLWS